MTTKKLNSYKKQKTDFIWSLFLFLLITGNFLLYSKAPWNYHSAKFCSSYDAKETSRQKPQLILHMIRILESLPDFHSWILLFSDLKQSTGLILYIYWNTYPPKFFRIYSRIVQILGHDRYKILYFDDQFIYIKLLLYFRPLLYFTSKYEITDFSISPSDKNNLFHM